MDWEDLLSRGQNQVSVFGAMRNLCSDCSGTSGEGYEYYGVMYKQCANNSGHGTGHGLVHLLRPERKISATSNGCIVARRADPPTAYEDLEMMKVSDWRAGVVPLVAPVSVSVGPFCRLCRSNVRDSGGPMDILGIGNVQKGG